MNRRLTALLAAPLLTAVLSSCAALDDVVEQFGPRPNAAVLELAQRASADADADTASPTATLRAGHATELFEEVERLCGVGEDGATPPSCDIDAATGEVDASAGDDAALDGYLAALPRVPAESVDLVVSQAVDLAAAPSSTELPDLPAPLEPVTAADAETLRGLLADEHAAVYALDIAQAYLDDAGDARVADLIDAHEQRITVLTRTLEPTGETPVAAPGYAFDGVTAPTDQAQAGQLVDRIAETTDLTWRNAAADAGSLATREWLVRLAGHAAKAAQLHAL